MAHEAKPVTIRPGSPSRPPLFCMHAEAGDVSLYHGLAHHLASDQPVLGLCAQPAAELVEGQSLEQMAARHARAIQRAQPQGPCLIAGECTGGALAYETARQLRAAGREVALLALIDAFPAGAPALASHMPRPLYRVLHRARILAFHVGNLVRLGAADRRAYVRSKGARARRALASTLARLAGRPRSSDSAPLAFRHALDSYDPKPYDGPVLLLRAARLPLGLDASLKAEGLGWGDLVEDLRVETIPGYFTTPISEPHVRTLAERLSRHLGALGGAA